MPKKRVVLVAGYDYGQQGFDFVTMCKMRAEQLIARDPKVGLAFILFDIGGGRVLVNEPDEKKRRQWVVDAKLKFKAIQHDKNYTVEGKRHTFNKNQDGVMSITDVYAYLERLGSNKNRWKSVVEFSIFSHGWDGGPILVNSDERSEWTNDPKNSGKRDPQDKDARKNKDFNSKNRKNPAAFRKAFASDAVVWVWGCDFTHSYFYTLHKLLKFRSEDPVLKKIPFEKLEDKHVFDFVFSQEEADESYDDDHAFFPQKKDKKGKYAILEFSRNFRQIKQFFKLGLEDTYFQAIAGATGLTCYGALPGTFSDLESRKLTKYPLMVIPKGRASKVEQDKDNPPSDFTNYIKFYGTYLGMTEDPEHRGYGAYVPMPKR